MIEKFMGVRVTFDPYEPMAVTCGFFWNRRIIIGPSFCGLTPGQQTAVLLHEAWHAKRFHVEIRHLLIPIFWTKLAARIVRAQELAADAYAHREGHGIELLHFLARTAHSAKDGEFYPTHAERVRNIRRLAREAVQHGIPT